MSIKNIKIHLSNYAFNESLAIGQPNRQKVPKNSHKRQNDRQYQARICWRKKKPKTSIWIRFPGRKVTCFYFVGYFNVSVALIVVLAQNQLFSCNYLHDCITTTLMLAPLTEYYFLNFLPFLPFESNNHESRHWNFWFIEISFVEQQNLSL